jgi:hypothetical protein
VSSAYFANGVLYEGSDERWKTFKGDLDVSLDKLKMVPKKYYTWNDDESQTIQIGTSAQKLYEYFPEVINIDSNGYMNVAYDRLAIVALAAIDKLNEEIKGLKETINHLSK